MLMKGASNKLVATLKAYSYQTVIPQLTEGLTAGHHSFAVLAQYLSPVDVLMSSLLLAPLSSLLLALALLYGLLLLVFRCDGREVDIVEFEFVELRARSRFFTNHYLVAEVERQLAGELLILLGLFESFGQHSCY